VVGIPKFLAGIFGRDTEILGWDIWLAYLAGDIWPGYRKCLAETSGWDI
jgi:hypothetical protein